LLLPDVLDRLTRGRSEGSSHPGSGGGESVGALLSQARPAGALAGGTSDCAIRGLKSKSDVMSDSLLWFCVVWELLDVLFCSAMALPGIVVSGYAFNIWSLCDRMFE
jgi:hypothetical protein